VKIMTKNSILHSLFLWGSLVAATIFCSSCTSIPFEVKSEVVNPAEVGKRSVAVIPDPYMDDLTTAKRLVDLVGKKMTQSGFRLSPSESKAELVIIPHLTSSLSGAVTVKTVNPVPRINLITPNIGEPGMMQNAGGLGDLPALEPRPAVPQDQIQLIIMAVQEDVWHKALNINQLRIPQVWRISVFVPTDFSAKGKEVTTEMVEAAAPRFAEIAGR
jgi:hypothetical protein